MTPRPVAVAHECGALREPDHGQAVRGQRHRALQLLAVDVVGPVPEVGDDGQLVDQAQSHGQRPATRVDHRVGEHHGTGGRAGHDGPAGPGFPERLEGGGALEHGLEVQWRSPGDVDEASGADDGRHAGVVGRGPVEHHETLHLAAKGLEPFRRAEHHAFGVLIGGRRGQYQHVAPTRGGQQAGIEGAPLRPLAPANQGQ